MSTKIAVLGAGPGGYVAAVRAAQLGAVVTVVEKEDVGGTCLNWGCIPSKIMQTTAQMLHNIQRSAEFAIELDGQARIDMARLMARKERILATQRKGIGGLFKHHGITLLKGEGRVDGPGRMVVRRADGTSQMVAWDKLILSTGSGLLEIPSFPFDGEKVISSNSALTLTAVPESIVIVGGGVIGCEFGSILAGMGTNVTVVEALPRLLPLPSVDEGCSKVLQREFKKRKIAFHLNKTVTAVDITGESGRNPARVTIGPSPWAENLRERDRKSLELEAEKVLVCIGRRANSAGLGLEALGVGLDEKGWIEADEYMQTKAQGVYAVGDALGPAKVMLAHVASTEGLVAAENAMGGSRKMHYDAVPGGIFTTPEVANVGLTETQAREQGLDFRADSVLFRTLGKAHVLGELSGEAKIVSETDSGKILGAHIIGLHATDLIAEATLAIQMGATLHDLTATIHAHPTLSEIMLETSLKAVGQALHG